MHQNNFISVLELKQNFKNLKSEFENKKFPTQKERIADLNVLKENLLAHKSQLVTALAKDYGARSEFDSLMADILPTVQHIKYSIKHLAKWMRKQKRHSGLLLYPSSLTVQFQPLGIVGIVVPWNFPINLSLGPIATALAAGNKIMVKLSEYTPETNSVIRQVLSPLSEKITVIEGELEVAKAFVSLPFNHILFTGSTSVGKQVMKAAADNLTPVTLELGGKSPVIIAPDISIQTAVERLILGKCINAGQICVAPDYILIEESKVEELITNFKEVFNHMYPEGIEDPNFTSIIDNAQYQRLQSYLVDAKDKGANIYPVNALSNEDSKHRLLPHLVTQVTDEMLIMKNEIFGPILPVKTYTSIEQAIEYINQNERPLALYIMSFDKSNIDNILQHTHSGGVCVNDTLLHVAADDAPFGGIGGSGMGQYHGKEGFLTFSHAKTVLTSHKINPRASLLNKYQTGMKSLLTKLFVR